MSSVGEIPASIPYLESDTPFDVLAFRDAKLPTRFADLNITEIIGRGAYGQVFLAVSDAGHKYALKSPLPKAPHEKHCPIKHEIDTLIQLAKEPKSPYIAPLVKLIRCVDPLQRVMLTEYYGDSIDKIRRHLSLGEIKIITHQMFSAVTHLFGLRMKWRHGDIRPANMVWDGVKRILLDFGIAYNKNSKGNATHQNFYCAPDRYWVQHAKDLNINAEIMSLALVISHLYLGLNQQPLLCGSPKDTLQDRKNQIYEMRCQLGPFPPKLLAAIQANQVHLIFYLPHKRIIDCGQSEEYQPLRPWKERIVDAGRLRHDTKGEVQSMIDWLKPSMQWEENRASLEEMEQHTRKFSALLVEGKDNEDDQPA